MGFVKLHDTILSSTVWAYDAETVKVWITLLVMADSEGIVRTRAPGISHQARIPLDQTERALKIFSEPDDYSSTRDFDGRRIEETDDGWVILNYKEYRKRLSKEAELERKRDWARKNRSVAKIATERLHVDGNSENSTQDKTIQNNTIQEADNTKQDKKQTIYESKEFINFWEQYPKKVGKLEAAKAIKKLLKKQSDYDTMIESLKTYRFSKEKQYIPNPATWLNQRRWEDEDETAKGSGIKYDA
jgi:hypothetical protein